MFETKTSLPLFATLPVDAIKIPSPVFLIEIISFALTTFPEMFTLPALLSSNVFPFELNDLPEIFIPLEPAFVISVLPAPKFFINPEIFVPPLFP